MNAQITAASVSRRLALKYTRSTASASRIKGYPLISSGFAVSAGSGGGAYVEWCPGERRFAEDTRRKQAEMQHLRMYQMHLDQWYVTKIEADGSGNPYLSVLAFKTTD